MGFLITIVFVDIVCSDVIIKKYKFVLYTAVNNYIPSRYTIHKECMLLCSEFKGNVFSVILCVEYLISNYILQMKSAVHYHSIS